MKARYEGQSINVDTQFGYCSSVFYDIKIKQDGQKILVKHSADTSKDNIKTYSNFIEFLKEWQVRMIYK